MKIRHFFVIVLSGMIVSIGAMAIEKPLRLDLNEKDIIEVRFTNETSIGLKLSDTATLKLKNITGKNIGKRLSVSYMKHVVVSATIQAAITSGSIKISNPSDFIWDEMKKLREKLARDQK